MATAALAQPRNLPAAAPYEWHWPEYAAEFAGTLFNIFVGLSAVVLNMSPGMLGEATFPSAPFRLLLTGLIYAGSGSLFAISPWGRLSGAHINPSVTLAFWAKGKMHRHDVIGYVAARSPAPRSERCSWCFFGGITPPPCTTV
ncbi:MAG: aquaporin [Chthoniobacterales bacterium]